MQHKKNPIIIIIITTNSSSGSRNSAGASTVTCEFDADLGLSMRGLHVLLVPASFSPTLVPDSAKAALSPILLVVFMDSISRHS